MKKATWMCAFEFYVKAKFFSLALLSILSCAREQQVEPQTIIKENTTEIIQKTEAVTPPTQDIQPVNGPTWQMESPSSGVTSTDYTPKIIGRGFSKENGQQALIYTDAKCSREVGRSTITKGEFTIRPTFSDQGEHDGAIAFYGRIVYSGKKPTSCENLSLGYTLNTKTSRGQSMYFRMTLRDDPATTAVIGFAASTGNPSDHRIYYDTEDHGRDIGSYKNSLSTSAIEVFNRMNNAFFRLKGLKPDTAYYFVIADPKGVSRRMWFKTAPDTQNTKLSIVAGGDSRNNRVPRQNANLLVAKLRPHFVMFGGDMTGGGSADEWREWFEDWQLTITEDGRIFPVLVARGNHESSNAMIEKFFDTPTGVYYAVSFADDLVRVYTLNTESAITGSQTEWLAQDLSRNTRSVWKFAQYHRPIRPHVRGKVEGNNQYNAWAPLFDKYRMHLVSESDAHTVKSTWPVRPSTSAGNSEGFVRDDKDGTIYIGEGGWGAPLRENNDDKPWTRDSAKFNHNNWIFVDRGQVDVRFIRTDNAKTVASLADGELFTIPADLDIWNPKNGSVITLTSPDSGAILANKE